MKYGNILFFCSAVLFFVFALNREHFGFIGTAILFFILGIVFRRDDEIAVKKIIKRKRSTEEAKKMNELIKAYIGKKCIITFFGGTAMDGIICEVSDKWIEIENKKGKQLVNADFIEKIEERAEKKK